MTRWIAFLRAINVGGHTVRMEALRAHFQSLGFSQVETFIASGNVVFEADAADRAALVPRIEGKLRAALGYDVAAFLRTAAELRAIAQYRPFSASQLEAAAALNAAFLAEPVSTPSARKVLALQTSIDDFQIHGREIYWLCRRRQSESTFSNAVLEKTTGKPSTLRGMETVRKLAAKYP